MIDQLETLISNNFKLTLVAGYFSLKLRSSIRAKILYIDEILQYQKDYNTSIILKDISITRNSEPITLLNILNRYMPHDQEGIEFTLKTLDYFEGLKEGSELGAVKSHITDTFGELYINYLNELINNKKIDYKIFINKLKSFSIASGEDKFNDPRFSRNINMGAIDPKTLIVKNMESVILTPHAEINNSYPELGLIRGQLGGIMAPPGVGKSIYLQNFGFFTTTQNGASRNGPINVAYFILADLNDYSFTTRHLSIALNEDQRNIRNPSYFEHYFSVAKKLFSRSFDPRHYFVKYLAPGEFTAREIYEYLKNEYIDVSDIVQQPNTQVSMLDWFDVIIIDYEGVLKGDYTHLGVNANLYMTGGDNMNVLKQLADYTSKFNGLQKIVLVAMQPVRNKRESLDITLDDISESAQKQRILDFAYTFASPSDWNYPNFIGKFRTVKGRMSDNITLFYLKDLSGRLLVRSKDIIERIKSINSSGSNIRYTKIKSILDKKIPGFYNLDSDISSEDLLNVAPAPVSVLVNSEDEIFNQGNIQNIYPS